MDKQKPWRMLNRDGTLNIDRKYGRKICMADLYHSLLSIAWWKLLLVLVVAYLGVNLIFGTAYFLAGTGGLQGADTSTHSRFFWDCFFFSVQTLATIGYGRISPVSIVPHILVTVEALVGLLGLALTTGLVFSRFSRPTARVLFSSVAVVEKHDGVLSFLFRMANERMNQVMDAQVSVTLLQTETTLEGEKYRNLYDLKLERTRTPVFALTWTVVHPIDSSSPLHGLSYEDLIQREAELLVTVIGIDEIFAQPISARFSYTPEDIRWNMAFSDILSRSPRGKLQADLTRFHDVEARQLAVSQGLVLPPGK